jgi:hypothetical protein
MVIHGSHMGQYCSHRAQGPQMAPYGSNLMCTAPIQCIWLQYNDIHLPYDNPKLPYGAYGSSLMPDDSHMLHRVHRDSTLCHMASKWLPYGSSGCIRAPSTSHVAPYGSHMGNMAPVWLTFGSHSQGAHLVHISHMALIQCMRGSHTVHVDPMGHMRLPYSACSIP